MTQSFNPRLTTLEPSEAVERLLTEQAALAMRERCVARLRLFWDRRQWILRIVGCGLVLFTLIAFLLPKRYESTTRLMPPDSQSNSGLAMLAALTAKAGNGLGMYAGDLLGLKTSGAVFVGILRSRTVEDRLVERFNLKQVYGTRLMEDARKKLAANTAIAEDRKSGIITVTVTDNSPQRAAAIAQAYVEQLDRLVAELTTSAAHRERVFLATRLQAVKQDLDAAAKQFSEFASKNATIDVKEQGRAMVEAAASLQGYLIVAQTEFEGLRQVYSDNNVRVRLLKARIGELQHQLEKMSGEDATLANPPSQGAGSLYPSIRRLPLLGVAYADLYRRTKLQETIYELLTQQYELAKVQEAKETPSVKVLDAANLPEKKSFPPRLLIISLGIFFSFVFAVLWVLLSTRWAEIDPQDPGKVFALEILTTLRAQTPWFSRNGHRLAEASQKIWGRLNRRQPQTAEHD